MKFQRTGRHTLADEREARKQRIACWLNEQRYSKSASRTIGEYVSVGMPTDWAWLREQVKRLTKPGDRTVARNLIARWEAVEIIENEHRAAVQARAAWWHNTCDAWLASLPAGAQFADARRGGLVAVLDGVLIGRLSPRGEAEIIATGQLYIESPDRPLRAVQA